MEYDKQDKKAFDLLYGDIDTCRESANTGDPVAQYHLGVQYVLGDCVKRDHIEAIYLFRKSGKQGNSDAICKLGTIYEVLDDIKQTCDKYRQAIDMGNSQAMYRLGSLYYKNLVPNTDTRYVTKAFELFRKSIELDNVDAMLALGQSYLNTLQIHVYGHTGLKLYLKAAELGSYEACARLGKVYSCGRIEMMLEINYRKAVKWYKKAIEVYPIYYPNLREILLNTVSLQSKSDFNMMTSILEEKYTYPQTVEKWLNMEDKYNEKIAFRESSLQVMNDYFIDERFIPKVILNMVVEWV